jgi:hypothetical protein
MGWAKAGSAASYVTATFSGFAFVKWMISRREKSDTAITRLHRATATLTRISVASLARKVKS